MKNINLIGKTKTASIDFKISLKCEECGSQQFKFQLEKNESELDVAMATLNYVATGATCLKCGYGYSLNIHIDNTEEKSVFN